MHHLVVWLLELQLSSQELDFTIALRLDPGDLADRTADGPGGRIEDERDGDAVEHDRGDGARAGRHPARSAQEGPAGLDRGRIHRPASAQDVLLLGVAHLGLLSQHLVAFQRISAGIDWDVVQRDVVDVPRPIIIFPILNDERTLLVLDHVLCFGRTLEIVGVEILVAASHLVALAALLDCLGRLTDTLNGHEVVLFL